MQETLLRVAVLLALLGCNVCGKTITQLNRVAAAGSIQDEAPVKAYLQVDIDAPRATVWALLVDVGSWPKWQPAIESVTITQPLAAGTRFYWKTGGTNIRSAGSAR